MFIFLFATQTKIVPSDIALQLQKGLTLLFELLPDNFVITLNGNNTDTGSPQKANSQARNSFFDYPFAPVGCAVDRSYPVRLDGLHIPLHIQNVLDHWWIS